MSLSKKFFSKQNRVPFEVAAFLLLILVSGESVASTGPSWSSQPDWASDSSTPTSSIRRSARRTDGSRYNDNISPFSPGSNNFALDVGQVFLMGASESKYSDSIGMRLHYTYGVSDLFAFDGSIGYSNHSNGAFSMTTLLAGMRTNLSWYDKVIPYLVFGLGFYRPSYDLTSTNGLGQVVSTGNSIAPILFGVHLGPGVDLELTKQLFFGASLTFHDAFGTTVATSEGPLSVGGTFTTFFLHAGFTF